MFYWVSWRKKTVVTLMERKNEKHHCERIRKYHSMKLTAKKLKWTQDHVIFTIVFSGFTSLWISFSEWRWAMAEPISSKNLIVNSLFCPRPGVLWRYFPRLSPSINSITIASCFSTKMQSMICKISSCFACLKVTKQFYGDKLTTS